MIESLRTLSAAADRLFIEIEDQAVRPILWAANRIEDRRVSEAPLNSSLWTGQRVDADLSQERRNPLRGWRWA